MMMVIFLLWFMNFPTLRYAGYIIVFLLIVFPYSIYVMKKINFSKKNNLKKLSVIFIISYAIFLFKNVSRINNEFNLSVDVHHNFDNFPFYWIKKNKFQKVKLDEHQLYLTEGSCWAVPSTCVRDLSNLKILKRYNYIFYINK